MAERSEAAALSARGVWKRFGGLSAVADVSLEVHAGEIHAVIGPNGAGKSTLINLLSGDLSLSAGTIVLDGTEVGALPPDRRARAGLGRSYQKTTIFADFTVHENVRLAAQAHAPRPLRMHGGVASDAVVNGRVADALARTELAARADVVARLLSHGEQRQLEIAMVLATDPRVILLDEPLAGMGQSEARRVVDLIASLKAERAVLIVEHDMDAVFELADRLTVMADGRVIASGRPADVRKDAAVRAAYLGEEDDA
ncbi:ABC transporter ATP-binding protein [Bradyrhizobium sp. U87765 SZCCT0131]|uniref:ABC transporter ATP-binding protein n=1 Tax=unclassified Bradyrhizobium TaxID=2631580 RepID=UPI001BA75F40|nr:MULTISPECIES: ABC transporter ATP-binding protein [unclassified Bradyrhizobium]MBR1221105.1 ABC transporter ATP-binding protein [Bradyrhizobium sp. U87765 SZCCT0131]MBR1260075.1 ABC transporter ATP-binding protein [Bradyrhizobium sp. U87765 SZCCT0134]MBR1307676.1 ABC transporter ATP-binding protein [Bradyrhizobium sp. U87765 SZCCT0110]MBR1321630.1 ABC transporter ATP-binding protein [Bradyrhizobium sp. U87765 SZCCT0109]MBR1349943.1 ABC transporter ATP-binding protein [Bradyrhizobium sp. U87